MAATTTVIVILRCLECELENLKWDGKTIGSREKNDFYLFESLNTG